MIALTRKGILYLITVDILLYLLLPLEVYSFQSRYIIYPLIWISLSVIVLNFFPRGKSIEEIILLIIGAVIYLTITCLFAFVFFLFCGWLNYGAVYKNKKHDSLKIICKTYDCYGTADDYRLYKQQELFSHVFWVTKFNDDKVDTTVWERLP